MDRQGWYVVGLLTWVGLLFAAFSGSDVAAVLLLVLSVLAVPFIPTSQSTDGFDHYEDTDHYQDRSGDGTSDDDELDAGGGQNVDADPDADGGPLQRPGRSAGAVTPTRTVVCSNCDQPVSPDNEDCEVCSSVGSWRK